MAAREATLHDTAEAPGLDDDIVEAVLKRIEASLARGGAEREGDQK
jgi:hypothetical protein